VIDDDDEDDEEEEEEPTDNKSFCWPPLSLPSDVGEWSERGDLDDDGTLFVN
tara:strand:- start:439 stop:594 length:156 start_codon:yes stop_codon:yes gene_type:complete